MDFLLRNSLDTCAAVSTQYKAKEKQMLIKTAIITLKKEKNKAIS